MSQVDLMSFSFFAKRAKLVAMFWTAKCCYEGGRRKYETKDVSESNRIFPELQRVRLTASFDDGLLV